ncbi:FecR domain-containing protein [Pseudoflavitalea rhizosphaerae]|uniref:FecR domain-containing protein n=1 Tax=Pseudoflavitalea rhizosphaerae TaxID=1884793 RepID=UPI000F8CE91D|nr:FecR domain-containing protein [Pseudoflavitalea rhizosphaerae]
MQSADLNILIEQYLTAELSPETKVQLLQAILSPQYRGELELLMQQQYDQDAFTDAEDTNLREKLFEAIWTTQQSGVSPSPGKLSVDVSSPVRRIHFLRTGFFRYAAAIILAMGLAVLAYLLTHKEPEQTFADNHHPIQTDIAPGGNRAMLTLADGSKIILDSAADGKLATQGGAQVIKLANGEIVYDLSGIESREAMWNTITTPRGGQYRVTLPDGTKVWLNAASSLTFPAAFNGSKREVKIDGEVYFEVSPNKEKPFMVNVNGGSSVEVLGTSFNVNAYKDETHINTTLLEGAVAVSLPAAVKQNKNANIQTRVVLKPGQQARMASTITQKSSSGIMIIDADTDKVVAWKNGAFNFKDASLEEVMRQLARWYDLEIVYPQGVPDIKFGGKMSRSVTLASVLRALKDAKINIQLSGERKLLVLP